MNKRRIVAVLCMAFALAALVTLAACSQPAPSSSSSSQKLEANDTAATDADTSTSAKVSQDPFYVLITGNDTREGTTEIKKPEYADGNARTDTMMLTRVDPAAHQITLVTVPRDTKDVVDGDVRKINDRYTTGGMEGIVEAVSELTGVKADYYINTTFVGFQDIINRLGGITVYVPTSQSMKDIVSGDQIELSEGEQTLDGAEALVFARERHAYGANQEALRQANDRLIMITIMKTILGNADSAEALTRAVYDYVETNMTEDELVAYVNEFAEHADEVTYLDGTGPYLGDTDYESGKWLTYRDEDTWREIIAVVDEGGDPNSVLSGPALY